MSRYKGRANAKTIERKIPQRGRGRHDDKRDYVRWCFADRDIAVAFAAEFGGAVMRGQS
jgi:hypothetical protein